MLPPFKSRRKSRGFTLLELTTVILVISILGIILLPVYAQVQRRMEKAACVGNLRSLHTAANLYVQDHHGWPQVASANVEPRDFATKWIDLLKPYGLSQINWICPSVQKALQNPDLSDQDNARLDYAPMSFDTNPMTPYRWMLMPWFAETADVHGNGQLLLFSDGHVQELGDFKEMLQKGAHGTH